MAANEGGEQRSNFTKACFGVATSVGALLSAIALGGGEARAEGAPLPVYTRQEVAKRDGSPAAGGRMWVTYEAGVYDITDFVASHPGGAAKILLGVGKDLGAFWNLFPFHREKPNVLAQLEAYRIGTLDPVDLAATRAEENKKVWVPTARLKGAPHWRPKTPPTPPQPPHPQIVGKYPFFLRKWQ